MKTTRILAGLLIPAGVLAVILAPAAVGRAASVDPEVGRTLFAEKQCARCHAPRGEPGAGPALEDLRRPQGEMELAGRLWNHVPGMLAMLAKNGTEWPRISAAEMSGLMVYLHADAARDPAPDLNKGQLAVLRKGCLKCHSLRKEGGPVGPDLADRHPDYESAAAWAAAMWTHTPRMAAMARARGIAYPRFAGDEMGNLLGFLRSAAVPGPRPAPGR